MLIGIDVSKYNKGWDPAIAKKPIGFGIQRASWSLYKDEAFDELYKGVAQLPVRGAYHYYSSGVPWKAQADLFLSVVAKKDFHFYVVDYEKAFNNLNARTTAELAAMIKYIAQITGKKCLAYFSYSIYTEFIRPFGWGQWAKEQDIWYAWYPYTLTQEPPIKTPMLPAGLPAWKIWQYGGGDVSFTAGRHAGPDYGGGLDGMDLNYFDGTVEDMLAWAQGTAPTIPTSEISSVRKGLMLYSGTRIRTGPSTNYAIAGFLNSGSEIVASRFSRDTDGNQWAQIGEGKWVCVEFQGSCWVNWKS